MGAHFEAKLNRHPFFKIALALAASSALVVAGCATQARTDDLAAPPVAEVIADKPQIWLPGASQAEVKSIAMGAAHSKGWTLVDEEDAQILFERPMDPTAPQAIALGPDGGTDPVVEVRSYFVSQDNGVRVALDAAVRTKGADGTPQKVDWTEAYRSDLMQSLESLRTTWSADRERVSAALAVRRSAAQSPALASDSQADLSEPPKDPLRAAWAAETSLVEMPAEPTGMPSDAPKEGQAPASAPTQSPSPTLPGAVDPITPPQGSSDDPGSGALSLTQRRQPAMWTYYAERDALRAGCALTEAGSRMVAQGPTYEIHEVDCANGSSLRLRCQHGFCRPAD